MQIERADIKQAIDRCVAEDLNDVADLIERLASIAFNGKFFPQYHFAKISVTLEFEQKLYKCVCALPLPKLKTSINGKDLMLSEITSTAQRLLETVNFTETA